MERIRLGLIGCGGNMRARLRRLTAIPEVRISGIAEPNPENVRLAREQYPALADTPVFASHAELLAGIEPRAVVISTPHTLHFEQIMAALDAGCHVLCEKPMTCSSDEARRVCEDVTITGGRAGLYYRTMGTPDGEPVLQLRTRGKTEPEPELPGLPESSDPDRAFVDLILGRAENEAPPECGLRTIQLSEAAWKSAAAGGAPVPVA